MNLTFKEFQKEAIVRFLALKKYEVIREKINNPSHDISKDSDFKRDFNSFFRVRREKKWQEKFYNYFQTVKNNKNIKFEDIIWYLYRTTGNIEASFSSKMLAAINPDMPIWDQFIVRAFNIEITGVKEKRVENIIKEYYGLIDKEKQELKKTSVQKAIKEFNEVFGEYKLSDIKILDYMLWNKRDKEQKKSNEKNY